MPKVDSLFGDNKGNSVFYQTSNLISNHNQESDLGVIGNVANIESDVEFSARQNLLKGLNMTEFFQTSMINCFSLTCN